MTAQYSRQEKMIHLIWIGAILLFSFLCWSKLGIITIVDDEFGYWGMAAQMAGASWDDLIAHTRFYSYGYGLLLVPLFWLGIAPQIMYKAAIILNVLMLIASYEMAVYFGKTLFKDLNRSMILIAAGAVTLFSNNVYQIYIGTPEMLIYFLFWCITVCILNIMTKKRIRDLILFTLCTVYIYAVHNRSIGVVLAAAMFLLGAAIVFRKERYGKYLFLALGMLVILFAAAEGFRQYTISEWYQNNGNVAVNSYSGQVGKLSELLSVKGIVIFILSLAGKMFSQGMGSLVFSFLIFTGVLGILAGKIRKRASVWSTEEILMLILAICYLSAIMINAIHKFGPPGNYTAGRILMGRYSDFVIGPVLMLCICRVLQKKVKIWEIICCGIVFIGCTGVCVLQIPYAESQAYISYNNMDLAYWVKIMPQGAKGIFLMGMIAAALFVFGSLAVRFRSGKQIFLTMFVLIAGFWAMSAVFCVSEYLDVKVEKRSAYLDPVHELVSQYEDELRVYYIRDEQDIVTVMEFFKLLQYWNPNMDVTVIELEELENFKPEGEYLVMSGVGDTTIQAVSAQYDLLYNSGRLCVYVSQKGN